MITDEEIKELRELEAKATKGTWSILKDKDDETCGVVAANPTGCDENDWSYCTVCEVPVEKYGYGCAWDSEHNARFISVARNALPDLLDEIEELRSKIGSYSVSLVFAGSHEDCTILDVGYADRVLTVECVEANRKLALLRGVVVAVQKFAKCDCTKHSHDSHWYDVLDAVKAAREGGALEG